MKRHLSSIKDYIFNHKLLSLIILVVISLICYQSYKTYTSTSGTTLYTINQVKRGTLVTTVTGTGQVSALNQIDLKTKTSGDLTYLNFEVGKEIKAGDIVASLDSSTAAYDLESSNLTYEKLITIDPDTLRKDQDAVTQAENNLAESYANARTSLASSLNSMQDINTGLGDLFDTNTGYLSATNYYSDGTSRDYQKKAEDSWYKSSSFLNDLIKKYKNISNETNNDSLESIISEFYDVSLSISESTKNAQDVLVYLASNDEKNKDEADTAYASVVSLVSKSSSLVSTLFSLNKSILNNKISLNDAVSNLETLKDGPDNLSVRSQLLIIKQKQETLNNYLVTAPFDGVIASSAGLSVGDTVSNGTVITTIITKQKIANISLNEIDAAKVKVGQKVDLTFDAIDDLNIVGNVSQVNLIGTVSQGVVSYNIQISFNSQDDKVKSGMTVTASIITDIRSDVLNVSNSSIKSQGNENYVEVFDVPPNGSFGGKSVTSIVPPRKQIVTLGLSNNNSTEILSGLKEGDSIVVKTTVSSVQASNQTTSISSLLSGNRNSSSTNRNAAGAFRAVGN